MTAPTPPVLMKRTVQRTTKGSPDLPSRKITYSLTVIQQPERARACGSGAKSSADRRPVDPPPVVELRIFQGDAPNQEDITFAYEANFFLFATLEAARPIARGRGLQQAAATPIPVLTGMPVSGMAYLDRPTEAGYFIFPDLSVRHEGTYCLSFNLYEETKHDHDKDSDSPPKPTHLAPGTPDKSFDWRLEVKSSPFTVFSAKKFPGLAESTHLSRTVAEQGCRVRIRRDVRMRRRDTKDSRDYDEAPEDDYARRGREVTSEPFRERSHSADSNPASPAYPQPHDHNGQYPYTPVQPAPAGGHLSFIDNARPQFQTPSHFAPPQPPAPQSYQQPQTSYNPPAQSQYRPAPPAPPTTNYGYDRQYPPHSAYPTNPARETYEQDVRRSSYPAPPSSFPPVESSYNRPPYHAPSPAALPPLRLPPTDAKQDSVSSPLGPIMPPINSNYPPMARSAVERATERLEPYDHYSAPAEPRNGKRPYDAVFSATASAIDSQRLANGERPNTDKDAVDDDEEEEEQPKLVYSRANGARVSRPCPPLVG